jgi:hypothetical protein
MERLWEWVRRLGTTGAVANARLLSDERERERWIVAALEARLAVSDETVTAA